MCSTATPGVQSSSPHKKILRSKTNSEAITGRALTFPLLKEGSIRSNAKGFKRRRARSFDGTKPVTFNDESSNPENQAHGRKTILSMMNNDTQKLVVIRRRNEVFGSQDDVLAGRMSSKQEEQKKISLTTTAVPRNTVRPYQRKREFEVVPELAQELEEDGTFEGVGRK